MRKKKMMFSQEEAKKFPGAAENLLGENKGVQGFVFKF